LYCIGSKIALGTHSKKKREETRKEYKETLSIMLALLSTGELEEAKAYDEKAELLLARMDQYRTAALEKRRAKWKSDREKRMAELEAKSMLKMAKMEAGLEEKRAKRKTDREKRMAELETERREAEAMLKIAKMEAASRRVRHSATILRRASHNARQRRRAPNTPGINYGPANQKITSPQHHGVPLLRYLYR
jgi:hypothetical protein